MKPVYCTECGMKITVFRKALPRLGRIIDVIEPHVCLEVTMEPDLSGDEAPAFVQAPKGKFMDKLNDLPPAKFPGIGTDDLQDRRNIPGWQQSSAPRSILTSIKSMETHIPEHNLPEPVGEAEMEPGSIEELEE